MVPGPDIPAGTAALEQEFSRVHRPAPARQFLRLAVKEHIGVSLHLPVGIRRVARKGAGPFQHSPGRWRLPEPAAGQAMDGVEAGLGLESGLAQRGRKPNLQRPPPQFQDIAVGGVLHQPQFVGTRRQRFHRPEREHFAPARQHGGDIHAIQFQGEPGEHRALQLRHPEGHGIGRSADASRRGQQLRRRPGPHGRGHGHQHGKQSGSQPALCPATIL